ncbi:hypothetical protein EVAR_5968_1 [Eumeta japonica]|uniref:Uncharacterized protein n=1 Tax=Eumeta variegata TaxID=151549 RepID=A0A4C1TDE2_EUMVA|nr:hypothetical protein EVAR_5968_1 [Eumeta japonica]
MNGYSRGQYDARNSVAVKVDSITQASCCHVVFKRLISINSVYGPRFGAFATVESPSPAAPTQQRRASAGGLSPHYNLN